MSRNYGQTCPLAVSIIENAKIFVTQLTSTVVNVRNHGQIRLKDVQQRSVVQLRIIREHSGEVAFDVRRRGYTLSLRELVVNVIDALRLAVRKMRPDEVPYGRRDALPQELPDLLVLASLRSGYGRDNRYPAQLALPMCLDIMLVGRLRL